MKAMKVRLPARLDSLTLEDLSEPLVEPGMVKVRWHASSLNFHDLMIAVGGLPTTDGRIPMSDGAGEIAEIGEGVSEWKIGDRVLSLFFPEWQQGKPTFESTFSSVTGDSLDGCATDFSVVRADALTCMPRNYSYDQAATLPCAALTAWRAIVEDCRVRPGDSVLIQGTGGMSMFALQFAKAAGAKVYATSSSNAKLERLREMGADVLINYRDDVNWGETVERLSCGGVDHVVDSGGNATLDQSLRAGKVGGNIVIVGVLGGFETRMHLGKLISKQQRLLPIAVGSREMQQRMVKSIETSDLKPVIDRQFALHQLAEAFRYQKTGQHFGKIVINMLTGAVE